MLGKLIKRMFGKKFRISDCMDFFFEKLTVNACCTGRVMNMNEEKKSKEEVA